MTFDRLIIEQFDPERPKPGGIDTCIRGIVSYSNDQHRVRIVGVDAIGNKKLGEWGIYEIGGRRVEFMPVARLDHNNLKRVIPHSARLVRGVKRYLPAFPEETVQSHRINVGAAILRSYPGKSHVQLIHSSGSANLRRGSKSLFRHFRAYYRYLEKKVVSQSKAVIVFNREGAKRLNQLPQSKNNVHFSPTWFDDDQFYPGPQPDLPRSEILWACRIEPAKNPILAIDVLAGLPDSFRMTVAGDGTLGQRMRDRATQKGVQDKVTFLGAVDKREMGKLMREHEILLMTSRFEGFSRSIVEALASGLPVVTTPGGDTNGLVVSRKNGARSEQDDAEELVRAVDEASRLGSESVVSSVSHLRASEVVAEVLAK